jgi:dethiobiotin synthetase
VDRPKVVFVTGTDTGVGKTVVTGLLLAALNRCEEPAFAVKPFASGSRSDARVLNTLHCPKASLDEVNPFHFRRPLAPLAAARLEGRQVTLQEARQAIVRAFRLGRTLLVEGCGGLLVPLGKGFTLLDLMPGVAARVIVVAANRLGVLNHTRLTVERIRLETDVPICVGLVDTAPGGDSSRRSNPDILAELLAPVGVVRIPYLARMPWQSRFVWHRPVLGAVERLLATGIDKGSDRG